MQPLPIILQQILCLINILYMISRTSLLVLSTLNAFKKKLSSAHAPPGCCYHHHPGIIPISNNRVPGTPRKALAWCFPGQV